MRSLPRGTRPLSKLSAQLTALAQVASTAVYPLVWVDLFAVHRPARLLLEGESEHPTLTTASFARRSAFFLTRSFVKHGSFARERRRTWQLFPVSVASTAGTAAHSQCSRSSQWEYNQTTHLQGEEDQQQVHVHGGGIVCRGRRPVQLTQHGGRHVARVLLRTGDQGCRGVRGAGHCSGQLTGCSSPRARGEWAEKGAACTNKRRAPGVVQRTHTRAHTASPPPSPRAAPSAVAIHSLWETRAPPCVAAQCTSGRRWACRTPPTALFQLGGDESTDACRGIH